jgi:FkbM family methyltransferase
MKKTVLGDLLYGWEEVGSKIWGHSIFSKNSELLRCKKHKIIEGKYLLSLSKNHSFLDVGSNFGDTVLTLALHARNNNRKDIRFFAFEPNKKKCEVIEEISKINNLNIEVYNCCVGNSNGYAISDNIRPDAEGGCSYKYCNKSNIKIIKLDNIENIITPIGLIHIDTEGWELEVLKGLHNILSMKNNNFILICECWNDKISKKQNNLGRTNGILTITPEKDILNLMNKYINVVRLENITDKEKNIVFKINHIV